MTAAVHILSGPAGSGKTGRLIERCQAGTQAAVGAALWIVPSYRHGERLRERLIENGCGGIGLRLLTFEDFAADIIRAHDPAACPLANVQRRLLVDDLLAELHQRKQLTHFDRVAETRGFAEGTVALVSELKRNEIRPIDFARAAYRRGYAGTRAARATRGEAISLKERECARVYARYQRLLRDRHLYDLQGRLWYARDLLCGGARRPFEAVRVVFVDGFVDFARTQHDILDALAGWVDELWIALPDEPGDDRAELFTRPRATLARLQRLTPTVHQPPFLADTAAMAGGECLPFSVDASAPDRPAGLLHLERQLFRPLRKVVQPPDADGILCLEAPGLLGEARMVARQIKALLLEGTPAEDILVTMRDLVPYADLLREVFAEYGIPVDVEGAEPLLRNPAVSTLLRALRLPDEDWPFAAVTALLRSGYFRPDWPETRSDPEVAGHAEVLLRLLGEPRHREAYAEAVRRWADDPPPGLEDEQAEESRRARTHDLAQRCRRFLERFFCAWDDAPHQAVLADHIAWLRRFAADLGLPVVAVERPADAAAWGRFQEELDHWLRIDQLVHRQRRPLSRADFQRRLAALAAEAGLGRTPRGPGRVRVLSAPLARTLEVPYLFVMGLGERGFPRLVAPDPLFDEQERQSFKQAGLDFRCVSDLLPDEMLLFYQVVTRARRRLVLSYPAVDDRGQSLLPSSFLHLLLQCFAPGAVPVERRRMLIERYDKDPPLCPAEYRVQVAARREGFRAASLPAALAENLEAAEAMVRLRWGKDYTPYDGMFRNPAAIDAVGQLFGPEKVFSPTALEDYIACPFRFLLKHVLRLEVLEEPREEIEVTRRGQAFHRALSRLHTQLKAEDVHHPSDAVDLYVRERLTEAVEEYVARAPSPASKMLWRLEGQRLLRAGARYRGHWQQFVAPWLPLGVAPRPAFFEVDFGLKAPDGSIPTGPLVIRVDDVEVRISGRIDRVDVADLEDGVAFWIIDYKTGRSGHYTGTDLAAFRRLQLTLYALAVEQVLLADRNARPLGLAYWLVSEGGPKVVLPARGAVTWFQETARWREVREQLQRWVATLVANIRRGVFALRPRSEHCTQTCNFSQVCRISQTRWVEKSWHLPLPGGEEE
jgi:ATP-dependent helicase/nuclease subunit B